MLDIRFKNETLVAQDPVIISSDELSLFEKSMQKDDILTKEQVIQLCSLVKSQNSFRWTKEILGKAEFISTKTYDSLIATDYPVNICKYSIPVFTKDKMYCLLYKDLDCGLLCGQWSMALYKPENGSLFVSL